MERKAKASELSKYILMLSELSNCISKLRSLIFIPDCLRTRSMTSSVPEPGSRKRKIYFIRSSTFTDDFFDRGCPDFPTSTNSSLTKGVYLNIVFLDFPSIIPRSIFLF